MAITSRVSSTTHINPLSLLCEAQISHTDVSEILWHVVQYLISRFNRSSAPVNRDTSPSGCFSRWSTSRKAVFWPTPGSRPNSATACSKSLEEKFIVQRYCFRPKVVSRAVQQSFQTATTQTQSDHRKQPAVVHQVFLNEKTLH